MQQEAFEKFRQRNGNRFAFWGKKKNSWLPRGKKGLEQSKAESRETTVEVYCGDERASWLKHGSVLEVREKKTSWETFGGLLCRI